MFERARGTRDFGPAEMGRRLAFERMCDEVAFRYGFQRVATPTFERLELFTAKSGASITDQLYAFKDRSDRDLTLRPELTAPVMRMIAEQKGQIPKPARYSYFGPCFRYEESKRGRYREFWQYGCEIIGAPTSLTEAEVVAFACAIVEEAGLEGWQLNIGHVGILNDILGNLGLEGDALGDAMRLLDKGDFAGLAASGIDSTAVTNLQSLAQLNGGIETLASAREIITSMGVESEALDQLEEMLNNLSSLGANPPTLVVDLTVARGLDYYTGMVFEIMVDELGGEGQVCGGGSYKLFHLFGLDDLDPCCGFGLGFDRVLLALEIQAEKSGRSEVVPGENSGASTLAVIPFKVDVSQVLALVSGLRAGGQPVLLELRERNIGKSMAWANSTGAQFAMVVGPRDIESGQVTIKRLSDGAEANCEMSAEAISQTISSM
ncbi:MAG TPA: histidine--tRNA ligase [Candidatus Thalassarchaeaceae archaeon]|nr:histidine--tRNA ligase [Euryarchaeota archaeon]MDP6379199.1 histidine--tRNA ligase [Candidatus Thalassarchaeaceae archaeon]HIH83024.1 histidine--tRNA ligase [Candidatus Thalassarchaeaceae archaeon]